MTIFVLKFGGQLVHLDMATSFWTSSRGRPGFDPGNPNGNVWSYIDKIDIFEILMKNCLKYPSPVKIRDVAGTPNMDSSLASTGSVWSKNQEGDFC